MPESVLMAYGPPGTRTVTSPVPLLISMLRGAATKFSTMSPVPLSMLTVGDEMPSPRTSPVAESIDSAVARGTATV